MAKKTVPTNPIMLKQGMSIGRISAEEDDEYLFECFVDYPPVETSVDPRAPGMILGGRTGAGKTAILRHILTSNDKAAEIRPADMSMNYVANSDILNFLQSVGADLDLFFQSLWKHVLCIEYIRLRYNVKDEGSSRHIFSRLFDRFNGDARKRKSLAYLREWAGKFWITMDENIKEITEKVANQLEVEFASELKKFKGKGQYERQISTEKKLEIARRCKQIISGDQLSELAGVIDILHEEELDGSQYAYTSQTYYILIDKLDDRWVDTSLRYRLTRALIESLVKFRRIRCLKIIVALRIDVLERVMQETTDHSFQREKYDDYIIPLRWNRSHLRELIQKRIRAMFRRRYSGQPVEFEHVFQSKVGNQEPLDYMLDRTLLRPRDIISFVNQCLNSSENSYVVTAAQIKKAEREYSRIRKDALTQEWQSAFPTLRRLLDFVASPKEDNFPLDRLLDGKAADKLALEIASSEKIDYDPVHMAATSCVESTDVRQFLKEILAILYRVGAVGIKLLPTEPISYSHLNAPTVDASAIPDNARVRIHQMLHATLLIPAAG